MTQIINILPEDGKSPEKKKDEKPKRRRKSRAQRREAAKKKEADKKKMFGLSPGQLTTFKVAVGLTLIAPLAGPVLTYIGAVLSSASWDLVHRSLEVIGK